MLCICRDRRTINRMNQALWGRRPCIYSNRKSHQLLDDFTSSHHRNLDQCYRSRTGPCTPQNRTTDRYYDIESDLHQQEISQRVDQPTTLSRKWDALPAGTTESNEHPTTTTKSGTLDTTPNHSSSLSRDAPSRTYRSLQDVLADSSTILVARNE